MGTPDFLVVLDRQLKFAYVNRTLPHLTPQQLVGKHFPFDFIPPDQVDGVRGVLEGVLATGEPATYEVQIASSGRWLSTQAIPHRHDGEVVGLILLTSDISRLYHVRAELERRNAELEQHKERLDELVAHRTQELQTAYAQLESIAKIDAVTGLLTRREVLSRLDEEVARVHRYGGALSILLLDLDHFKQVNDTHGHVVGDNVLAAAGGALRAVLRSTDHAGRYGGEELIAVAPETPLQGAAGAARRVCRSFAALSHQGADGPFQVTCSVGVATLREGMSAEDLVRLADAAMYRAKAGGRNQVVVDQEPTS